MSKSQKIMTAACLHGIAAAERLASELGLKFFVVDAGPGSRIEVWNKAWNRRLATGLHVSKYAP